jgi:hypothetical protein
MKNVLILTSGGIGDCVQAYQCAEYVKRAGDNVTIGCMVRDEVYEPLSLLFQEDFRMFQLPSKEQWAKDYYLLKNQEQCLASYSSIFDKIYYTTPDVLFNCPLSFDWKAYNVHPNVIRSTRLLTKKWDAGYKKIYCGLTTSTSEYVYSEVPNLLREIALRLPDHIVFFNNVSNWAGHKIEYGDLGNLPLNVHVAQDLSFSESLVHLRQSAYCVCLDNGISHIAYQLGIPRTLLSVRASPHGSPWLARWYPDVNETLPYIPPADIADAVKTNVEIPQTTLIPRLYVANYKNINWKDALIFKW